MRGRDIIIPSYEAAEGVRSGFKRRKARGSKDGKFDDEPYCAGYMNQSIGPIEHRQGILMTFHKPVLHGVLFDWEKEACPAELLKLKDSEAVRLSDVYD